MAPAPIASGTAATTSPAAAAYPNADATAASASMMAAVTTVTSAAVMAPSTAVAAVAVTSTAVAVTSTAVAAVTAMADKFYERGCSVAFLVEDVERRQADIRDFFLTESDLIAISGI